MMDFQVDPVNLAYVLDGNGQSAAAAPSLVAPADLHAVLEERVHRLVGAYRERGHLCAELDPLGLVERPLAQVSLESFHLSPADLDAFVSAENVAGPDVTTLRELIAQLEETYCRHIGVEQA